MVVPVYGCAGCLRALHTRLAGSLASARIDYELLFVDDASEDGAGDVLELLRAENPGVSVVSHRTNAGQHASIADGLLRASGQFAAVIDCDLQDPPELIPGMLARARAGADIVVAKRRSHGRKGWRRAATGIFGYLARRRHRSALIGTHSVFSVVSRRAIDGFLAHPDRQRMYLPVLESLRLPVESVDYDRAERPIGRSAYRASALVGRAWHLLIGPARRRGEEQGG